MDIIKSQWPVLFVSAGLRAETDIGVRLRALAAAVEKAEGGAVIESYSCEDALEMFVSRADLGAVVVDWRMPDSDAGDRMAPQTLIEEIRRRNRKIPVVLLTDATETENISTGVLKLVDGCLWPTADAVGCLAARIGARLERYVSGVYSPFLSAMIEYVSRFKCAWRTPGHNSGHGFLRAPAGVALHKYFGHNVFRCDFSASVPELGGLRDHDGVTGEAECNSARAFGADYTYYVLNGGTTANQIVWRSRVAQGDIVLVDRNCHKSIDYAMIITGAVPVYMQPRRNKRGIVGPVRLMEFTPEYVRSRIASCPLVPEERRKSKVRMAELTNSTRDGICYNTAKIREKLEGGVETLHFDESWYAYARFNKIYDDFYGLDRHEPKPDDPPVFCVQSTHKMLTAFSQASMLHIRNGGRDRIDPGQFNESYMMHGSTSPQYSMIASLDVATRVMQDSGAMLTHDIIREAIMIRRRTAALHREFTEAKDWFFDIWQPGAIEVKGKKMRFEDIDPDYLATRQDCWVLSPADKWHGFEDVEADYLMLDPIKLTFLTPGVDDAGGMTDFGIPAIIVAKYLAMYNIVCEKVDCYSFLLLNSMGTARAKQGALLGALLKFKHDLDGNAPLEEVFPDLVRQYPKHYRNCTLRSHVRKMHEFFRSQVVLERLRAAFDVVPTQAMRPADAFECVARGEVEYVRVDEMSGRVAAVMLVPCPPGVPLMMGGELLDRRAQPILDYLETFEAFEEAFPGYEGAIHGMEREKVNGRTLFSTLCVKREFVK